MENYICINGKKAELTEEQMKALGIELPKPSPFERVCNHANDFYHYYFISSYGFVTEATDRGFENGNGNDDLRYRTANYCTDEALMKQRALHETLNRLLWRYSMEHKSDTHKQSETRKDCFYSIGYWTPDSWNDRDGFYADACCRGFGLEVYFDTKEIAENAIKEIVEPFMKAHPEFKW